MDQAQEKMYQILRAKKRIRSYIDRESKEKQKARIVQSVAYILGEGPNPIQTAAKERERKRGFSVGKGAKCEMMAK